MKSLLKNFNPSKKVFKCPNCVQSIRVPIKMGKTLRIQCPNCHHLFEVRFTNPITEVFKWNKSSSFSQNISAMKSRFQQLPKQSKLPLIIFAVMISLMVFQLFTSPEKPKENPKTTIQEKAPENSISF